MFFDTMKSEVARLQAQIAADRTGLGVLAGALLALFVEATAYATDRADAFRGEVDTLDARVTTLEEKIAECCSPSGPRTPTGPVIVTLKQRASNSQIAVQTAGAGTGATAGLAAPQGTGEIYTLERFLVSVTGAGTPAAGDLLKVTPTEQVKGPIGVRLSPGHGTNGGTIFDLDPYYDVNYASDGVTVASVDVGVGTAITASASYLLQVELFPATVS